MMYNYFYIYQAIIKNKELILFILFFISAFIPLIDIHLININYISIIYLQGPNKE
jgi:hypothetical protein